MGFIHGMLNWAGDASRAERDVATMIEATATFPWIGSAISVHAPQGGPACALGVQRLDGADGGVIASKPIVGDLRLEAGSAVAKQCDRGRPSGRVADEAVAAAVEVGGLKVLERLRATGCLGMWDQRHRRLLLWRDIAGSRPLYLLHRPGDYFAFSSDLRAISACRGESGRLDLEFARALLDRGPLFVHPSRTPRRDVTKLPAAHVLIADENGVSVRRYWHPDDVDSIRYRDVTDYAEELRALLSEVVSSQIPDTGEVGAHLSGGLDSSSVAVVAGRALAKSGRSVRAMSWAPPFEVLGPVDHDERVLAVSVAEGAGLDLHFTHINPQDFVDANTADLALHPATTLQAELTASRRAARAGIRTILSGWGGDETVVFNGRGYFSRLAERARWTTLTRELRMQAAIHERSVYRSLRGRVVQPLLPDWVYYRLKPLEFPALPSCLRPDFYRALSDVEPLTEIDLRERPGVRSMQTKLYLAGHLQYRMESWTAHGAELGIRYEFPFLDRRVIEFALGIPEDLYFRQGWKRWLFRTAMDGILPDEVRWNPTKFDTALFRHKAHVGTLAGDIYQAKLREHLDNPFVDLGAYADPERRKSERPDEVTRLATVAWLAWTSLRDF